MLQHSGIIAQPDDSAARLLPVEGEPRMGYFGQGIVLTSQPAPSFLEALPHQFGYTLFAHRTQPTWLFDMFRAGRFASHTPLMDRCGDDFALGSDAMTPVLHDVLSSLTAIASAIDPPYRYGQGWTQ